ncbi:zinc finger MYM-type protein 1-like [Haematobia irritans]|uniref:zinc finger MYM-type protein 1-like n=1 Tax=Haematobia irritans TaxID=7368 RepID=UPI003F4FC845
MVVSAHKKLIEGNRKIISSLLTAIIFCGSHDLPLRGKNDLANSTVTAYSILADESADISGKEQLSVGIRFFDTKTLKIREEFLGFVELEAMDDEFFFLNEGLDEFKCVGQGYDGCATMVGKFGGVQALLKQTYPKALYFHCASHKLNLVINDLNTIPEVRNTISTIKDIINFFRESCMRRKYAPNIPLLSKTRWSHKYKSIGIFKDRFVQIVKGLESLITEGNSSTQKTAFQLHSAATKSVFLICVVIVAEYSAMLEPVANALQSKSLDLIQCAKHIERIVGTVSSHRKNVDLKIKDILNEANELASEIGIEILKLIH